jgi:hypothetical protein
MKRKEQSEVEVLAIEFCQLNEERIQLERRCRYLKKRQVALQEGIQDYIGIAEMVDVPLVTRIGKFFITQVKKHRFVEAYECSFVEFKIVDGEN